MRLALLFGLVSLLAACSSISLKEREEAERARIESYAGQPVDHFTWLGRYDGWKPLGKEEALVWTSPDKAYLSVQRAEGCPGQPTQPLETTKAQTFVWAPASALLRRPS
jgi:hypothetical protein